MLLQMVELHSFFSGCWGFFMSYLTMPTSFHCAQMNVYISQTEKLRQRDKHQAGVSGLFNKGFRNSTNPRWASHKSFLSCLNFFFFATPGSIWDLSSLTGDWTCAPCSGQLRVLITGLPGKSLLLQFPSWFFSTFSVQFFFFFGLC